MQKNYVFILFYLAIAVFSSSCSNDSVQEGSALSEEVIRPYISPGMQSLINTLDTAQSAMPINELIPSFEKSLINDEKQKSNVSLTKTTEDDGTTVSTGYTTKSVLFSDKQITFTDVSIKTQLIESLGITAENSGPMLVNGQTITVYMRCIALTKRLLFILVFSFFTDTFNKCSALFFNKALQVEQKKISCKVLLDANRSQTAELSQLEFLLDVAVICFYSPAHVV